MKQQKYYNFLQKQILLMMGLSLIPGLVYVIFGWVFNIVYPALIWYGILVLTSLYGWKLYKEFSTQKMDEAQLKSWYQKLTWFMYVIFSSWTLIFVMYVHHDENNLHYIAIFTQLGAAVVASALLISDKKLFVPICPYFVCLDVTTNNLFCSCWCVVRVYSFHLFTYLFSSLALCLI